MPRTLPLLSTNCQVACELVRKTDFSCLLLAAGLTGTCQHQLQCNFTTHTVTRWPVSDSQVGDVCLHWHSCASDQVSRELVTVQVRGSA